MENGKMQRTPGRRALLESLEGRVYLSIGPSLLESVGLVTPNPIERFIGRSSPNSRPPGRQPFRFAQTQFSPAPQVAPPTPAIAPANPVPTASPTQPSTRPQARQPSDFRYVLKPGPGFTGPTTQPAAIGNPAAAGYDAKAIARWDVVPYQTFDSEFNVGVVAFHMNGIDRVEFSVNGGDWVAVRNMTLNPQTDVYEYTATLRASDFADGQLEVRAVAYPTVGEARVLESLALNANSNGTLPTAVRWVSPTGSDTNDGLTAQTPKLTVVNAIWSIQQSQSNVDGAKIYLLQGTHSIAGATWPASQIANSQRWLTIEAAPDLGPSEVKVRGAAADNRLGYVQLLRWRNLTINATTGNPVVGSWIAGSRAWFDGVTVDGQDRNSAAANNWMGWTSHPSGKYITDSTVRNVQNAANGFALVRNVQVSAILSDAFSGSMMVINSSVTDINQGSSDAHPDILQYYGGNVDNIVIYGLRSDPDFNYPNGVQGLFVGGVPNFRNVAVVNCVFSNSPSWSATFAVDGAVSHMYVKSSSFRGPASWGNSITTHNVVFEDVTWSNGPPVVRTGVSFR